MWLPGRSAARSWLCSWGAVEHGEEQASPASSLSLPALPHCRRRLWTSGGPDAAAAAKLSAGRDLLGITLPLTSNTLLMSWLAG